MTRKMAEMTWMEVRDAIAGGSGVILPIGATEQHGPHLPICVDTVCPEQMAVEVGERTNMLVAPPLAYGYRSRPTSGGGQTFPATTSLRGSTLQAMVEDILKEFVRSGFKRIVLLSWHVENQNWIYEAAFLVTEEIKKDYQDVTIMVYEAAIFDLKPKTMEFVFGDQFPGWAIEHASICETSVMLYKFPELVHFDRAIDDCAEYYPVYDILPIPERIVAPSGTLWKATLGTEEKGKRIWEESVDFIVEGITKELGNK
ncbi:creatininase [Clostridium sp. AM58-1XD]|uniref:creatininase n=1 Tax=Clostridium sp. AM58-1XD TaxID=2292307 RepID=UPI000E4EFFD3|nr:creatininase [Clostridium sp. AM58-1XD]RGY98683.1 creatininase [Clostridium sp. AM58-1XD]